jgi:hypothetical protein
MFWSTLILAVPALALAAAVWGVLRRKWYGVLPLLAVAAVGWLYEESWWPAANDFFEGCANQTSLNQVMMLFLVDGVAVMSLVALWAGWSRAWWFWRALLFAAIPASLAPLEANELILICLVSMPILTTAARLGRWWHERNSPPVETKSRPGQVALTDLFLAFVVLGLFAVAVRSILVGHIVLAESSLFWLAAYIAGAAVAAALPSSLAGSGKKWLIGWSAALLVFWASSDWLGWRADPLGLANHFRRSRFPATIAVYQVEGEICFLLIVGLCCGLYAATASYSVATAKSRMARAALGLALLVLVAPVAAIYPRMLPPRSSVTPLPPSEAHDTILRAALRLWTLESQNVKRGNQYLAALQELDHALPTPGHVTYDATLLAQKRLATNRPVDPTQSLATECMLETSRALHEGRDADVLRLARLQWRVGQSFSLGGTLDDYASSIAFQRSANQAIMALAPSISDQECRNLMQEARALDEAEPDPQRLKDFDEYWQNVSVGWRDRLHDAAAWLTGERDYKRQKPSVADLEKWRGSDGIRTVQYVLALELHRREEGQFPHDLSSVQAPFDLPELLDPYTDFAPVYRRTGAGYLLYSIGKDGKDDGGKIPPPGSWTYSWSDYPDINLVDDRTTLARQWVRFLQPQLFLQQLRNEPAAEPKNDKE